MLRKFSGWERRFDSPAGLTGLSQVVGKMNQDPLGRLQLEGMYSQFYQAKDSNILFCDFFILYYTVRMLLFKKTLPIDQAMNLVSIAPRD